MSDKSEAFDQAFAEKETGMEVLARILDHFDLDFFAELGRDGLTYTVRLWDQGEQVAECSGTNLENVLREMDKSAAAIANYG